MILVLRLLLSSKQIRLPPASLRKYARGLSRTAQQLLQRVSKTTNNESVTPTGARWT